MLVTSAVELLNRVVYKPGWEIEAIDHTDRFESAVKVCIRYPAQASERIEAADGYPRTIQARMSCVMLVGGMDDTALYRALLAKIIEIEVHESREFLRVLPTYWAPFHPHREDGMARWGSPEQDLMFGLA